MSHLLALHGWNPFSCSGPYLGNQLGTVGLYILPRFLRHLSAAMIISRGNMVVFSGLEYKMWRFSFKILDLEGSRGSYVVTHAIFLFFFSLGFSRILLRSDAILSRWVPI